MLNVWLFFVKFLGKMVKGTLAHAALPDVTLKPPVLSGIGSNSAGLRVDVKEDSTDPIPVKSMLSLGETEGTANLLEKYYGERKYPACIIREGGQGDCTVQ